MRTLISSGWHTAFLRGFTSLSLAFPGVIMAQETIPEETVSIDTLADTLSQTTTGLDTVWMLLAAMLVFFMQPGFAMVEAGFARCKNTANILLKNLVDFMVGSILFWIIGFGLMFGIGGFVGTPHWGDLSILD